MSLARLLARYSSARRQALRRLAAVPAAGWVGMSLAPSARAEESDDMRSRLAAPAVADVLSRFVDVLIPEDELTPAASAVGVPDRIVAAGTGHALYARLIVLGCAWLDRQADGRFSALPEADAVRLLEAMGTLPADALPRRFLEIVRDDAMYHYYSQPASWNGLAVSRPPQPLGYDLG